MKFNWQSKCAKNDETGNQPSNPKKRFWNNFDNERFLAWRYWKKTQLHKVRWPNKRQIEMMEEKKQTFDFMKTFWVNFDKQEFQSFSPLSTTQISQGWPILSKSYQLIDTPFLVREGGYGMHFFWCLVWRIGFSISTARGPLLL